jgi:hypothetical protein
MQLRLVACGYQVKVRRIERIKADFYGTTPGYTALTA